MKRFISILAAFVMAALPLAAAEETAVSVEEKTYNKLDSFDAIQASWIYKIELTQSRNQSVKIEAPDFAMPYLVVKVKRSCLILDMEDMPLKLRRKLETGRHEIRACVSMKKLSGINMSGATKLKAIGEFHPADDLFELYLSGASSVKSLNVTAPRANIECSGASKFQMEGKLKEVKAELSGAANGTIGTNSKKMDLDLSGAAKLKVYGNQEKVRILASSAANLNMEGTAEQLTLTGSGAAKIDMLDCPVLWANVGLSGASNMRLEVHESLGVRLSGASTCQYRAGNNLQLVETDVARGSTLRKL